MYLLFVAQINGRDRVMVFVSPPPGVDWPQGVDPTTQTSVGIEDVNWAVLGVGEEAAAKATGKRPAASKRRQEIFTLSDDDTEEGEDADIFRLVPRKRRQLESTEQGGSSMPVGPTSPTTATRRTSGEGVEHQALASMLDVEGDQVSPAQHVEQARPKRRASNM